MKKFVALLTAVCLLVTPITVFAITIERSDLEEMSVKELKELRDMINEILGDDGGSTNDIYSKHPEWAEIDANTKPYSDAIVISQLLKESTSDESKFKLKKIRYNHSSKSDYYYVECYVPNKLGGTEYYHVIVEMKDGSPVGAYDPTDDDGFKIDKNYFWSKSKNDIIELDVNFIESQLE